MSGTSSRYIIGIDLGTTNSVLAYLDTHDLEEDEQGELTPKVLSLPQLIAPGQVDERPVLPSFLYLSAPGELPQGSLDLPWTAARTYVVGEFARQHGGRVPMRLISSAKSWLSHAGVDRKAPILPHLPQGQFEEGGELPRLSPVDASARYLMHLRDAWDHQMAAEDESLSLRYQDVLLTVPASFDAVGRDLTVQAAHSAGLTKLTLLEEPQAAFYAWLSQTRGSWRSQLHVGDVVLVCDIGGGTTDFSLIAVSDRGGDLDLSRIAVGDHILLGGDNMDLALSVSLLRRLEGEGHKLDPWQRRALVHSCRLAKESIFSKEDLSSAPVVVLGRGAKVIGGSIKTEIYRTDVETLLLDGFLPKIGQADRPRMARRGGLQEMGLPFAADAGITRHLAKFLGDHRVPSAVLFNGGVMKGEPLKRRITEVLKSWGGSVRPLVGTDLDLAVAQGAAYYGQVRRGKGLRIRGGTARAYYIGFEAALPAVPGMEPPLSALCVAPRGMEEGTETDVPGQELGLVVGEPVEFRFLTSSTRKGDQVGDILPEIAPGVDLEELAPVQTALTHQDDNQAGTLVPIRLRSHLTEVGVLELWCVSRDEGKRWKLSYDVREHKGHHDVEKVDG